MTFNFLFLKYAVVFAGIGSATVAPLLYSFGDGVLGTIRGGRSGTWSSQFSQVSSEGRKTLSTEDIQDYGAVLSGETQWDDLSVNHAFYENMKRMVEIEEFKKIYGALDLKEEDLRGGRVSRREEGPNGANNMTILDAWEKFFREESKEGDDKMFSYFKGGVNALPFWNYDFPYIAVEFPKAYKLPDGLVADTLDKGWVKVDKGLLPTGFYQYGTKWKGLTDSAYNFKKVMESKGTDREEHKRKDTLNKIMRASPDADLYLVASPEKLLRMWLGEWKESKVEETSSDNKYALFKNNYYAATSEHPELSLLSRWHEGKIYRMWIHHKTLKDYQVGINSLWKDKKLSIGKDRFSVSKDHKYVDPRLKWGNNFLLNLMTWYAYTYKLSREIAPERTTYQSVSKAGSWNLREIYDLDRGANSKNPRYKENFAKWIKDWYTGEGRGDKKYWEDVYRKFSLTDMTHFVNRWERIQWIGKAMDELSNDWGKLKTTYR